MYTDDQEYTAMRLVNTVVRDKDKKVLVEILHIMEERNELRAGVRRIQGDDELYHVSLDSLDLSSPLLGNVDYLGHTYFISRMPKRNDWRQGLRKDNLVYVYEGVMHNYNLPYMKLLNAPVFNKYKPYKKGRAFSRNFSVDTEGNVWYKCREKIGKDINGVPILDEKYEWLKEALEDALER